MTPATSVHAFDQYVENSGLGLTSLTVRAGINAMLSFYEAVAPMGCIEEYGDMLLFQWGTYDKGDCPLFTINITRQFIESAEIDDDAISQLQLTFEFPPDEEDAGFGAGNRWCRSQSELTEFRDFIHSNVAFLATADKEPPGVSVHHEHV
jgi:hypothetical protein